MSGSKEKGAFDLGVVSSICQNIKNLLDLGIGVSIVVGGGNIVRGKDFYRNEVCQNQAESCPIKVLGEDLPQRGRFCGSIKETADSMGMLSTVINGLLLRDVFGSIGIDAAIVSHLELPFNIESANCFNVSRLINENKVLIFVAGMGLPYFSTDTASIVNGLLARSDLVLKATKTDGVYDKDPEKYKYAKYIKEISYEDVLNQNIQVMDQAAFALAKANNLPILIFSIRENDCFVKAISGEIKHSRVG